MTLSERLHEAADQLQQSADDWSKIVALPVLQYGQANTIAVLREAADALDASGWQPMETAPKDGTPILAYGGGCLIVEYQPSLHAFVDGEMCRWAPLGWQPLLAPPRGATP